MDESAGRLDEDAGGFFAYACGLMVRELDAGHTRLHDLPRPADDREERDIEIALPSRIWAKVKAAAEEAGVSEATVVEHAGLTLANEISSGAIVERLIEAEFRSGA